MTSSSVFATDPATARYYDRRAGEYDDWYEGTGLFADRTRPDWAEEVTRLTALVGELVIVDSAARDGVAPEQSQERMLGDGSRHRVYKRYLSATGLAAEIGGEPALDRHWFVAARVAW